MEPCLRPVFCHLQVRPMNQGNEKKITLEALEAEIVEYLNRMANKPGGSRTAPGCNLIHGKACALGTCVDNKPRVTPIDLYNDGLIPWLAGEPGGKIANIMRNPNVSIGVYEPVNHRIEQKSLQIWGQAELINIKNDPREFARRITQFGIDEALRGMIEEFSQGGQLPTGQDDLIYDTLISMFNLIKVTPNKMVLLHMRPGMFPLRKTWEPGKATLTTQAP